MFIWACVYIDNYCFKFFANRTQYLLEPLKPKQLRHVNFIKKSLGVNVKKYSFKIKSKKCLF